MTIGELIHQKRIEKQMTLDDLGRICNVPKSTVSRWENGIIKKISRDKIEQLCLTLDIDPVVFFHKEEILSKEELDLVHAFREVDSKVQEIVMGILLQNKKQKTMHRTDTMVG